MYVYVTGYEEQRDENAQPMTVIHYTVTTNATNNRLPPSVIINQVIKDNIDTIIGKHRVCIINKLLLLL